MSECTGIGKVPYNVVLATALYECVAIGEDASDTLHGQDIREIVLMAVSRAIVTLLPDDATTPELEKEGDAFWAWFQPILRCAPYYFPEDQLGVEL